MSHMLQFATVSGVIDGGCITGVLEPECGTRQLFNLDECRCEHRRYVNPETCRAHVRPNISLLPNSGEHRKAL